MHRFAQEPSESKFDKCFRGLGYYEVSVQVAAAEPQIATNSSSWEVRLRFRV